MLHVRVSVVAIKTFGHIIATVLTDPANTALRAYEGQSQDDHRLFAPTFLLRIHSRIEPQGVKKIGTLDYFGNF